MIVGKMVAGQFAPVIVALKDNYNNIIPASTIESPLPVVVNWNANNYTTIPNERTFVLDPGINQTVAGVGIIIQAFYGPTLVASFNGTCYAGHNSKLSRLLRSKFIISNRNVN
jgi:hypothetical protein